MIRIGVIAVAVCLLASCTVRGTYRVAPDRAAAAVSTETVFVRTDRVFDGSPTVFGAERSAVPNHARFEVSIPPNHAVGRIERSRGKVDPDREFTFIDAELQSQEAFLNEINQRLLELAPEEREMTIFVHGYNTNFTEAIQRHAQIMHDFNLDGAAVTFAWSSAANALGYIYDRDSAEFASSDLARLIEVLQLSRANSIQVIAHSMGSLLTLQAMHQMALSKDFNGWQNLDSIFLISPDIDVDLFLRKTGEIGRLPGSFVIFTSSRDRALALSGRITGTGDRLGSIENTDRLSDLNVTIVNLRNVVDGDRIRHTKAAASAETIETINALRELTRSLTADEIARRGFLPGTVLTIRNATEVILEP